MGTTAVSNGLTGLDDGSGNLAAADSATTYDPAFAFRDGLPKCSGWSKSLKLGIGMAGLIPFGGGILKGLKSAKNLVKCERCSGGMGERIFVNRLVGVDSKLVGHSYARGSSGLLNRKGSRFKFGWTSSGEFGGGWHLRCGVGRNPANPNQALRHWDLGSTHVPNDVANDLLEVIRGVRGL